MMPVISGPLWQMSGAEPRGPGAAERAALGRHGWSSARWTGTENATGGGFNAQQS
jgi:hypothetical protein